MAQVFQNGITGLYSILSKTFPLLLCAVFPALLAIGRSANAPRKERWKNALHPLLAIVFGVAACTTVLLLNDTLNGLLNNQAVRPFIDRILNLLNLAGRIDYGFALYKAIAVNLAISAAYIVFKFGGKGARILGSAGMKVIRWAIRKLKKQDVVIEEENLLRKKQRASNRLINLFYEDNPRTGKRTIRVQFIKICKIFRIASYLLMGIWLAFSLFAQVPVFKSYKWFPYDFMSQMMEHMYLYPVISLIVLFEIADFLDGEQPAQSREITDGFIYDDETQSRVVADYGHAIKPLKSIFQDRFRTAASSSATVHQPENTEISFESETVKQIERYLQIPLDETMKSTMAFFSDPVGPEENKEILHLIDSLEKKEDCLADASLYVDLGTSFMVYLNICLYRGNNILVLCADDLEVRQASRYLAERLKAVNQFSTTWIIKTESRAVQSGDCDILVTTPARLEEEAVQMGQEQFFEHVSMVMVPNTVRMLICYGSTLSWLIHSFDKEKTEKTGKASLAEQHLQGRDVTLLLLNDGLPAELRKTAEHMTGRTLQIHDCRYSESTTRVIIWNAEGNSGATKPQERLFGRKLSSPYIGIMMPLALASYKLARTDLNLISRMIPYQDILQILRGHAAEVKEYLEDNQGLISFEKHLSYQYGYNADRDPVVLIEDDSCNLPALLRTAFRYRGKNGALVHILSSRYMLRDYFLSLLKENVLEEPDDRGLFPLYIQSDAMRLKELASEFRHFEAIREERLMEKLKEIECLDIGGEDTLERALTKFREFILKRKVTESLQYDFVFDWGEAFDEEKANFEFFRTVRLREGLLKKTVFTTEHEAKLLFSDETLRLGFAGENIYQHFLPGQSIVCDGVMYRIDDMDAKRGLLYASAAPESLESPTEFLQDRSYSVEGAKEQIRNESEMLYGKARVTVSMISNMTIRVSTKGYYSVLLYDPAVRTESMLYNVLREKEAKKAERCMNAPVTTFRMTAADGTDTARASMLLAVVMQELMKTFFPYSWQEIAVCPMPMETVTLPDLINKAASELADKAERTLEAEVSYRTLQEEKDTAEAEAAKGLLTEQEVMELLYGEKAGQIHQLNEEEADKEKEGEEPPEKPDQEQEDTEEQENKEQNDESETDEEKARAVLDLLERLYPKLDAFPYGRKENEIGVIFIQDSYTDTGIAQTLKKELEQSQSRLLMLARDYLNWVRNGHQSETDFLNFGMAAFPAVFDVNGLVKTLNQLPREIEVEKAEEDNGDPVCCYCGRKLGVRHFVMKDGIGRANRRLCEDCYNSRVYKKADLKTLFEQAQAYLKDNFDVEMPEDLVIKFASAKSIRKAAKTGELRLVLGFAFVNKNQLWVEKDAPAANLLQVLIHEMTHIWQHNHLDFAKCSTEEQKIYKEGHSSFMEVRFLLDTGRKLMAKNTKAELEGRKDEYGTGFRTLMEELDEDVSGSDPFKHMLEKFPPETAEGTEKKQAS